MSTGPATVDTSRNRKKDRRCDKFKKPARQQRVSVYAEDVALKQTYPFVPSTVCIKSTGDQQLHEEAQAQHRPAHGRQEMLKAEEE